MRPILATIAYTLSLLVSGLAVSDSAPDQAAHARAIEQWRTDRVNRLTSETGWLTLVGLYWLKDGENTFGRAPSNTLVLDHPALPPTLGSFVMRPSLVMGEKKVQFVAGSQAGVTHDGKAVAQLDLASDKSGKPTILAAGSLRFFVIDRSGKLGIRVRDVEHPARRNFKGIEYFPISTDWVLDATFEPHATPRKIPIVNILGMTEQMESPGAVVFEKGGQKWRVDAVLEAPDDKEYFIMFADSTNGHETYGAGRFMYIPRVSAGPVQVDFNKAYNPPCAFNDFATCPLPPKQNRLKLRVEAGEKSYGSH